MKKISIRRIVKNISYIFIPIYILAIIASIGSLAYVEQYGEEAIKTETYFESEIFKEDMYYEIYSGINILEYPQYENAASYYNGTMYSNEIEYNGEMYKIYRIQENSVDKILIDSENKILYISEKYYNYGEINISESIKELESNKYNFKYEQNNITTTINGLEKENIEKTGVYENLKNSNYIVYIGLSENLDFANQYNIQSIIYEIVQNQYTYAIGNSLLAVVLLIIALIFIIIGSGRKGGKKEIHLNFLDKIPLEIVAFISFMIYGISFSISYEASYNINSIENGIGNLTTYATLSAFIIVGLIYYILTMALFETFIKRIKTKTIFKTTIIYMILSKLKYLLINVKNRYKIYVLGVILFAINIFIALTAYTSFFVAFLINIIIVGIYMYIIMKEYDKIEDIRKIIGKIHKNEEVDINVDRYTGDPKEVVKELLDIKNGFSEAIEEQVKSEKMKTELITNVSHDIKTPLTSIINYVDLLKKENIQNEKAEEYLEILEQKSFRLKKLTEDLVEISKASSGNIEMNFEELDIVQLVNQINGEFEDKFKKQNLSVNIENEKEKILVSADSRYLYRVFENLYTNIYKYAMEGTRVYIDISEVGEEIRIELKNISKQKIKKDANELVQRFTREDKSRTEEGSGLGLAIVKNLVELQEGEFDLIIDGDLFKAVIVLRQVSK